MKRIRAVHLLLPVLLAIGACSDGSSSLSTPATAAGPEPASVLVRPEALAMRAGDSVQLQAQVNDDAGNAIGGSPLQFAAEGAAIATVTATGLVTATGPVGDTAVRVTSGRREIRVPVSVGPAAPAVLRVVTPVPEEAAPMSTLTVEVHVADAFGNAVPGMTVAFAVTSGDGRLATREATADADGIARTTWRLGPVPGVQLLEARLAGTTSLVLRTTVRAAQTPARPIPPAEDVRHDTHTQDGLHVGDKSR